MDPLSITAASLSIAKVCATVGWGIKEFIDGVKGVPTVIGVLRQNVERFQNEFEVRPQISLEEGIKLTWAYINQQLQKEAK